MLSWSPPLHKNGPTAYEITQYDRRGVVKKTYVTEKTQQEVDTSCVDNNATFSFTVVAVNVLDGKSLRSEADESHEISCIISEGVLKMNFLYRATRRKLTIHFSVNTAQSWIPWYSLT